LDIYAITYYIYEYIFIIILLNKFSSAFILDIYFFNSIAMPFFIMQID